MGEKVNEQKVRKQKNEETEILIKLPTDDILISKILINILGKITYFPLYVRNYHTTTN